MSYNPSTEIGGRNAVLVGDMVIFLPRDVQIRTGEHILVISKPQGGLTDLYNDKIYLISQSIRPIDEGSGSGRLLIFSLLEYFQMWQSRVFAKFERVLGEPHASLVWGIIFGGNQRLSDQFKTQVSITGLSHVLSASGYNVVVVLSFSQLLFTQMFSRRKALGLTSLAVLVYAFWCGFNPPIVRALIMGEAMLLASYSGKVYRNSWLIWITGMVMLIIQPFQLYSLSFQLSFLSTLGLIYILPLLQSTSSSGGLFDDFYTSLAAYFTTFPLTARQFGQVSVVAPVANLLLLWLVPPIMLLSLVVLPLVICMPDWLGQLILLPVWLLLEIFIRGIEVLSRLPGASLEIANVTWLGVIALYLVLIIAWILQATPDQTN